MSLQKLIVHGGASLSGAVRISGSKNSALPILAATLLTREPCVIHHVPDLSDIELHAANPQRISAPRWSARAAPSASRRKRLTSTPPTNSSAKCAPRVCVLGPLLGRTRRPPWLAARRLRHRRSPDRPAFARLRGARARWCGSRAATCTSSPTTLEGRGAISLRGNLGPTVLGTDNVMMAAVLAEGITVIEGAAAEPEVRGPGEFPHRHGCENRGRRHAAHRHRRREGAPRRGARRDPGSHRGRHFSGRRRHLRQSEGVTLRRVVPEHLTAVTEAIDQVRLPHRVNDLGDDHAPSPNGAALQGVELSTEPYPGFPTDMQAQMCALLCHHAGHQRDHRDTFSRSASCTVSELKRMGANIQLDGATAIMTGVDQL